MKDISKNGRRVRFRRPPRAIRLTKDFKIRGKRIEVRFPLVLKPVEIPEKVKYWTLREKILFWFELFLEMYRRYKDSQPKWRIILEALKSLAAIFSVVK